MSGDVQTWRTLPPSKNKKKKHVTDNFYNYLSIIEYPVPGSHGQIFDGCHTSTNCLAKGSD